MADVNPIDQTTEQPVTDDQELAKVLAGVSQQADDAATAGAGSTFVAPEQEPTAETADDESAAVAEEPVEAASTSLPPAPLVEDSVPTPPPAGTSDLDTIKQQALSELQPLVDKLDVSPEEKFDTYLLLLRSTDDRSLIAPAHEAAKSISDETRRAQALLDIIKEIDFLNAPKQ